MRKMSRMKNKIVCLVLCVMLTGCLRAGSYDLMPVRKKIFDSINNYPIEFVEQEEELVRSAGERDHNYVLNKAITVKKGEAVLSDKRFYRDVYRSYVYKPTKKGALQNHSFPMKLDNKKEYRIIGWTTIDGVRYAMLDSGLEDYVFLFDERGNFYNRAGWIDDGTLKLLEEQIFVYPSDMKMQTIAKFRDEVSNVQNGYEVRYNGVKLDRIWFDYMVYDAWNNDGGHFERISFPNKPGLINIHGKGFRVLKADKDTLTYMILTSDE